MDTSIHQLLKKRYHTVFPNVDYYQMRKMKFNLFLKTLEYLFTCLNKESNLTTEQKEEIFRNTKRGQKIQTFAHTDDQRRKQSLKVCVKSYPIMCNDEKYLEKIYAKSCHHPNLCKILNAFLYKTSDDDYTNLYVVEEFVQGESLKSMLDKAPIEEARIASIVKQCLKALKYLHDDGLAHSTLQSTKIMISADYSLKLIGLQLCKPFKNEGSAKELSKIDIKDLRNISIEMKDKMQNPTGNCINFISFLKDEFDIDKILRHTFLLASAPYGPKSANQLQRINSFK